MLYRYGMKYRGYSPMCQPKGVKRVEKDPDGKYHNIILYERKLSDEEIKSYELDYLGGRIVWEITK